MARRRYPESVTPEELARTVADALAALAHDGELTLGEAGVPEVRIERPKIREHGDYATNVALQLAKRAGVPARELAELLADRLAAVTGSRRSRSPALDSSTSGSRPPHRAQSRVTVLAAGDAYGCSDDLAGQRINLEFVSANPTGPIHARAHPVGGGRRRARAGCCRSTAPRSPGSTTSTTPARRSTGSPGRCWPGARGAEAPRTATPASTSIEIAGARRGRAPGRARAARRRGAEGVPARGRRRDVRRDQAGAARLRRRLRRLLPERALHETGAVERGDRAAARPAASRYEADGALWLRIDRLRRRQGPGARPVGRRPTYICRRRRLLPRQARARVRPCRDHARAPTTTATSAGYRALAAAFGDDPDQTLEILIGQMVNLRKDGEPLRMSKRAGTVLTLDDLVEPIGVDAAATPWRATRSTPRSTSTSSCGPRRTSDNPVFYVQYAHARLASILRNAAELGITAEPAHRVRPGPARRTSARATCSARWRGSAVVEHGRRAARAAPRRPLPRGHAPRPSTSSTTTAACCRAATRRSTTIHGRGCCWSTRRGVVLANGLRLLGVSAPERM